MTVGNVRLLKLFLELRDDRQRVCRSGVNRIHLICRISPKTEYVCIDFLFEVVRCTFRLTVSEPDTASQLFKILDFEGENLVLVYVERDSAVLRAVIAQRTGIIGNGRLVHADEHDAVAGIFDFTGKICVAYFVCDEVVLVCAENLRGNDFFNAVVVTHDFILLRISSS